jgi:hypothetical protein
MLVENNIRNMVRGVILEELAKFLSIDQIDEAADQVVVKKTKSKKNRSINSPISYSNKAENRSFQRVVFNLRRQKISYGDIAVSLGESYFKVRDLAIYGKGMELPRDWRSRLNQLYRKKEK